MRRAAALAIHDTNRDGVIDPRDHVWGILRLWVDRSHDGVAGRDEQYSLAEQGVIALSLEHRRMDAATGYGMDVRGNWHLLQGTYVKRLNGGRTVERSMHDVFFRVQEH